MLNLAPVSNDDVRLWTAVDRCPLESPQNIEIIIERRKKNAIKKERNGIVEGIGRVIRWGISGAAPVAPSLNLAPI